jgi:hypothetical protein
MNELQRLWQNTLAERSNVLRAQKALSDAQKKYSTAVDLFHAETQTTITDAILTERAFNVANGETGI